MYRSWILPECKFQETQLVHHNGLDDVLDQSPSLARLNYKLGKTRMIESPEIIELIDQHET
jgi:hypothetical protein